jgi:gluconokinase
VSGVDDRTLLPRRPHVMVMGASASGKTSVARALADALGASLVEGDDHHPASNVAKMAAGIPLTDEDREPWLAGLAAVLRANDDAGRRTILACSALRRAYRDRLRAAVPPGRLFALELDAPRAVLATRMQGRRHFMPPGLLDSQLATHEPLDSDEPGRRLEAAHPLDDVVAAALAALGE